VLAASNLTRPPGEQEHHHVFASLEESVIPKKLCMQSGLPLFQHLQMHALQATLHPTLAPSGFLQTFNGQKITVSVMTPRSPRLQKR
jgi:hypothetical protein